MQGALSALLASVAGHYAQLSPSDVGIGLTGGRLAVQNVTLRPESFESPALPFRIVSGRAGALRINVPWSALSSAPVTVYLEDVALVAARRTHRNEHGPSTPPPPELPDEKWHQTRLGRVLFNVRIEIHRLSVEYRDPDCVARVEAATLRAHSVDADGEPAFVPLDDAGGAVAMRKRCEVNGLRCVMRPAHNTHAAPCFENVKPLLEDVNVVVRALVCAGECLVGEDVVEGLHTQLDVEIDDPAINISKRQLEWFQFILDDAASPAPSTGDRTPRRIRSVIDMTATQGDSTLPTESRQLASPYDQAAPYSPSTPAAGATEDDADDGDARSMASFVSDEPYDYEEVDEEEVVETPPPKRGGLFSFWSAIVEENSDETVDDAAFALGFRRVESERRRLLESRDVYDDEEEEEDVDDDEEEGGTIDMQDPKTAVETAVTAGGFTLRVRLRTPDERAWTKVRHLEEELRAERELREGLEDMETTLRDANVRVQVAEANADDLSMRNDALQNELNELEEMTSKAARNKDAIIRQTEAALLEAQAEVEELRKEMALLQSGTSDGEERTHQWARQRKTSTDTFVVNHYTDEEDEVGESDDGGYDEEDGDGDGDEGMEEGVGTKAEAVVDSFEHSDTNPAARVDETTVNDRGNGVVEVPLYERRTDVVEVPLNDSNAKKMSPTIAAATEGQEEEWYVSAKIEEKAAMHKTLVGAQKAIHNSVTSDGLTLL